MLAAWTAIFSGLVQLFLGIIRAGWLINLITSPVLNGFTQAAALLIIASQLTALLGLRTTWNAVVSNPMVEHFDTSAAAYGFASIFLLLILKRWRATFPSAILVVTIAGFASWITGYADKGGEVIGHLPSGLPPLEIPDFIGWNEFNSLLMPILVISLVSFLETASSAQMEHRQAGTRWNENQDLIAQGTSKIFSGLFGSFATSASFSRSAVNLMAGAKTGYATLFAILLVVSAVLWFIPALYHIPKAALAAIVVTAVLNLFKPSIFLNIFKISKIEGVIALATLSLTLTTAPNMYWGVLAGIVLSLSHFLYQRLHPRIIEIGLHPDGSFRDRHLWGLQPLSDHVLTLRMDAELDFASSQALEKRINEDLKHRPEIRTLYLAATSINRIDVTGVEMFLRLRKTLRKHKVSLHIGGLKLPIEQILFRAKALDSAEDLVLHRTEAQALHALRQALNTS